MKLINFLVLILVISTSIRAEGEGEQPPAEQPPPESQPVPEQPPAEQPPPTELVLATTVAPPVEPVTESWELIENIKYSDFRMNIDHILGNVLVQIVGWQANIFDNIQSNLSPLLSQWNELKSTIREAKSKEEIAIRSADVNHSKSLLQQQVSLLKEALSTGNQVEYMLVREQEKIDQWIVDVGNNVQGARDLKVNMTRDLEELISGARIDIKSTKSSIQKIFQNHYYVIENDRLSMNGKLDRLALDFKATLAQLVTSVQVTNNSVSNRLSQEANGLQETIDWTVADLRRHLDSNLMATDRDKIVNHLDERAQQLDENLFTGHGENQLALDNYARNLIADINNNIWSLDNDMNTIKNQFEQLTAANKLRANRLSVKTYKTLEPVESLLSSLAKKLQRLVDNCC
ncbi:uncharacterized protein LOC128386081 [Panonychus citri]|uniref:uncharacterized protein LOC128386081 n=1 Tax=Panonychus citri TaxID=50023 RepID=UPI0023075CB5|nr:uncharacterized protein LOC128386081 [Panonychus citri]